MLLLASGCKKEEELVIYESKESISESSSIDIYGDLKVNPNNLDKDKYSTVDEQQWLTIDNPYFIRLSEELAKYDDDALQLGIDYKSRTINYDLNIAEAPTKELKDRISAIYVEFKEYSEPYKYYTKEQKAYYENLIKELDMKIKDRETSISTLHTLVAGKESESINIREYNRTIQTVELLSETKTSITEIINLYSNAITNTLPIPKDNVITESNSNVDSEVTTN
jgi:hypothetical protein